MGQLIKLTEVTSAFEAAEGARAGKYDAIAVRGLSSINIGLFSNLFGGDYTPSITGRTKKHGQNFMVYTRSGEGRR